MLSPVYNQVRPYWFGIMPIQHKWKRLDAIEFQPTRSQRQVTNR